MIDLDDIDTDEDGALTATVELPGGRRVTVEYNSTRSSTTPTTTTMMTMTAKMTSNSSSVRTCPTWTRCRRQ